MNETRRGRPPKQDKIVRDDVLYVRLSTEEKRLIDQAAAGGSVVDWARRRLLAAAQRRDPMPGPHPGDGDAIDFFEDPHS